MREIIVREDVNNTNKVNNSRIPYWWDGLKHLDQPMILLGPDATILGVNKPAEEKLGYSEKELFNNSILDITHKTDQVDQVNNYLDTFYGTRQVSSSKLRFQTSEDRSLEVVQSLYTINDTENYHKYALLFFKNLGDSPEINTCSDIQKSIENLQSVINMFDLEEFGSIYNKEIVAQIKAKLNELIQMVKSSKAA